MQHTATWSYQDYMIHGMSVRIGWDDELVANWLHLLLTHFGLTPAKQATAPCIAFDILTQADKLVVPDHAVEVDQHHGVITRRAHDQLYMSDAYLTLRLDPLSGYGLGVFEMSPTLALSALRPDLVVCSLILLLRHQGLFALHAACLECHGTGYLFVADSDNGKSTLACSLMRQGWYYLSDDSIFLRSQGHELEALAFRKDLMLDPEAEDYFPDVVVHWAPAHVGDASKRLLHIAIGYPHQMISHTIPEVLIFPQIVDAEQSELVPLDNASDLHHLVRQSLVVTFEPAMAELHLGVLTGLLRQVRSYQLNAGRDVLEQPAQVASRLAELALPVGSPIDAETRLHQGCI